MKKFTKVLSIALASVMMLSFAGCGSASTDGTDSETTTEAAASDSAASGDKFIWATNAEFEPYEYREGDAVVGIDAELADAIAAKLGKTAEVTDMAFDSVVPAVVSGKADVGMAGMTVTEERKQSVNFSDPYVEAGQVIIVKKGSDIKSAADLENKTVGVQLGTTGDLYVSDENNIKGVNVERMQKGAEAVQSLIDGRADAVVIDNQPAKKFVAANADKIEILPTPLTEESYAIAVAKDNTQLLEDINKALAELKESGELDAILDKYLAADDAAAEDAQAESTEATTAA